MKKCNCSCNKKYGPQENDRQIELDKKLRKEREKAFGFKLTDSEWFFYKIKFLKDVYELSGKMKKKYERRISR